MEWHVEINFKLKDANQHSTVGKYFKSLVIPSEPNYQSFIDCLESSSVSNRDKIESEFSQDAFTTLFEGVEKVVVSDKKIHISSVCGTGAEECVPRFMKFVLSCGGKPLACSAEVDDSLLKFKHTKNGISLTIGSSWGDDG